MEDRRGLAQAWRRALPRLLCLLPRAPRTHQPAPGPPSLAHVHEPRLVLGLVLNAKPCRPRPLLLLILAGLRGSARRGAPGGRQSQAAAAAASWLGFAI